MAGSCIAIPSISGVAHPGDHFGLSAQHGTYVRINGGCCGASGARERRHAHSSAHQLPSPPALWSAGARMYRLSGRGNEWPAGGGLGVPSGRAARGSCGGIRSPDLAGRDHAVRPPATRTAGTARSCSRRSLPTCTNAAQIPVWGSIAPTCPGALTAAPSTAPHVLDSPGQGGKRERCVRYSLGVHRGPNQEEQVRNGF